MVRSDAAKNAPVKIEQKYYHPREVHSPMELANIIAIWEEDKKVTDKTPAKDPPKKEKKGFFRKIFGKKKE